jgi:hypothetical protein
MDARWRARLTSTRGIADSPSSPAGTEDRRSGLWPSDLPATAMKTMTCSSPSECWSTTWLATWVLNRRESLCRSALGGPYHLTVDAALGVISPFAPSATPVPPHWNRHRNLGPFAAYRKTKTSVDCQTTDTRLPHVPDRLSVLCREPRHSHTCLIAELNVRQSGRRCADQLRTQPSGGH